jgi:NAD(P)-dependent dehydrogenase (short-subunit alcohol dehydrogenase family)
MSGRSIIVTGGFGALGSVTAAAFAAQGDKVARVDLAREPADADPSSLDLRGIDLTNPAAAAEVVATVSQAFGGVDVLINVAGGFKWETTAEGSLETWRQMYAMNAISAVTMTKAALPALRSRRGARIINIGAGAAIQAAAGMGSYAASKAAVHRFTESLAAELAEENITVNAILPGIIDTPANRASMPGADFGKWVHPKAIAEVILFLASPSARAISGALIPVTRGAGV